MYEILGIILFLGTIFFYMIWNYIDNIRNIQLEYLTSKFGYEELKEYYYTIYKNKNNTCEDKIQIYMLDTNTCQYVCRLNDITDQSIMYLGTTNDYRVGSGSHVGGRKNMETTISFPQNKKHLYLMHNSVGMVKIFVDISKEKCIIEEYHDILGCMTTTTNEMSFVQYMKLINSFIYKIW